MIGKNSISRRKLLAGLAAASSAAAAPSKATAQECPEFIALGDALPELLNHYQAARLEVDSIVSAVMPTWPEAPKEIRGWYEKSKREVDIRGAGIQRPYGSEPCDRAVYHFGTPHSFEMRIKQTKACIAHIMTTKSKRGLKREQDNLTRYERALPLSQAYVAEINRITERSGYQAAEEREAQSKAAIKAHVGRIMDMTPLTMEGVVIQAQALSAWRSVRYGELEVDVLTVTWPGRLASAILAQSGVSS